MSEATANRLLTTAAQILNSAEHSPAQKAKLLTNYTVFFNILGMVEDMVNTRGREVMGGPLKGLMMFPDASVEISSLSRLMGTYEYPLHPTLANIIETNYDTIINIGCAEGYYAVGLARLMPHTKVIAADIEPNMRQRCERLAAQNNVADRVSIVGALDAPSLESLIKGRTLILCDIEGAEEQVLDITWAPSLAKCDMLVELHEVYSEGLIEKLKSRFAKTHNYKQIETDDGKPSLPAFTRDIPELEKLLMCFEGREGYTPWGWWTAKA